MSMGAVPDPVLAQQMPGMGNLRRMRVEDVMIPTAEIVAVPVNIDQDALITEFRDSGFHPAAGL